MEMAEIFTEIKDNARRNYQVNGWFRIRCLTDRELHQLIDGSASYAEAYQRCQDRIHGSQKPETLPADPGLVSYIRDFSRAPSRIARKDWRLLDQLTDTQLGELLAGATTEKGAWSLTRTWIRERYNRPKMTTAEWQSGLAPRDETNPVCWEFAIEGLGAEKRFRLGKAKSCDIILAQLAAAGFKAEKVDSLSPNGVTPTLAVFAPEHMEGSWLIMTSGHCLAIKDGVIFDTMPRSGVKRVIESAYQVTECPALAITYVGCECNPDPLVFGHDHQCTKSLGGSRQRDSREVWY